MILSPRITCVLFLGIIAVSHGQKLIPGTCPALNSFANPTLTLANLVATWREIARTPTIHRHTWRCVNYVFTVITTDLRYTVSLTGIQKIGGTSNAQGTVDVVGGNGVNSAAGTYFTFTITKDGGKTTKLNYYIVSTDNANYIVLYACENFLLGKIHSAIVLAKAGTADNLITAALNSLSKYGIGRNDLFYSFTPQCL